MLVQEACGGQHDVLTLVLTERLVQVLMICIFISILLTHHTTIVIVMLLSPSAALVLY